MHRADNLSTYGAALFDLVERMTDTAPSSKRPAAVAPEEMRWAAARRVITAAIRTFLDAEGVAHEGTLFADDARGITPRQRQALALLTEPTMDINAEPRDIADLGALYPALLLPATRKRAGTWYTPTELTEPTVRRTLSPLLTAGSRRPRVCDPAVGAGAFLVAALEQMMVTGRFSPSELAAHSVFGVDVDPTAASLAALALHKSCGYAVEIATIEKNVRCADGLAALDNGSFDAVIGNPPWETLQLSRREGATGNRRLTDEQRSGLLERFRLQGRGKLYTYRLFVERALQLLRTGGRLGLIVPASLYFDRDAAPLREHLLDACQWEWLFAFENSRRIFAIDRRYRFAVIIAERGGRTRSVRTSFLRNDVAEWNVEEPPHFNYSPSDARTLSPFSGAFVEVRHDRDLELLRRLYEVGQPWLGEGRPWRWRQGDFNMTSDRGRFVECATAERDGYRARPDGTWRRRPSDPVLRPLYQGAMIYDLAPNARGYAGGTGRGVRWREVRRFDMVEAQYLVRVEDCEGTSPTRTVLRALSNATNERTAVACLLGDEPCGNSLGVLTPASTTEQPIGDCAFLAGVLGSLIWDWGMRQRLAGTNLNGFVLADTVLPPADTRQRASIARLALQLCAVLPWHEPLWQRAHAEGWVDATSRPTHGSERRACLRAELDVEVAAAFGLNMADLQWILRGCDHDPARLRDQVFARSLDSRGFWRVDRDLAPARRLPQRVLALAEQRLSDKKNCRTTRRATAP